jgi:hypothetical protein
LSFKGRTQPLEKSKGIWVVCASCYIKDDAGLEKGFHAGGFLFMECLESTLVRVTELLY